MPASNTAPSPINMVIEPRFLHLKSGYRLSPGSQILFMILDHTHNPDGSTSLQIRFWLKFPHGRSVILIDKVTIIIPAGFTYREEKDIQTMLLTRFLISISDGATGLILFRIQFAPPTKRERKDLCSTSLHGNALVGFFVPQSGACAFANP